MQVQEAIILAGGFGTRLKSVVQDIPKPMAPIGTTPFLAILINKLAKQDINHIILAVGYKYEVIQSYFGSNFNGVDISYAIENEPLGTGGAVMLASSYLRGEHCFIFNGDTMFDIDLLSLESAHFDEHADVTLALKEIKNQDRYGTVQLQNQRITAFKEKEFVAEGLINGGIYLLSPQLLKKVNLKKRFSLEKEFFEAYVNRFRIHGLICSNYFIDIGIPEDYKQAQIDLSQ